MNTKILRAVLILGLGLGNLWAQAKHPVDQKTQAISALPIQGQADHYKPNVPPQEKARKNPVRFTDLSVDRGRRLFQAQCVLCHGVNADGKGDFVGVYGVHPPDFTHSGVLGKRTDGELFYIIGAGSEKMPGKHTQLTEEQRWDLVNYLRALEGKIPAQTISDNGKTALFASH